MFEDIRQHLSEVPEGELIEESLEERSSPPLLDRLSSFLRQLTPSQRLVLLGLLLIDLFLLGFFLLLIAGALRLG
ncbi:hypothetical protein HRbin22_02005 [Candidatus Thermoflexus japonica]|uniref:Uncharacterized protein n=1 Tax=Candidatus Thermoflexus japonica TaxID=2035417 RepID=A0A2H5Y8G1_9CHLR|nr:hypothetical protein HRbin22_02005 [Candidatus Thermoflexus japonica]